VFSKASAAAVKAPADPRILALLPRFERRAARFAVRYRFAISRDDAVQLARIALWECSQRAPDAHVDALAAYAWKRARGAIIDHLRVSNGGRRNAVTRGAYGFAPELVHAARTTGVLPAVAHTGDGERDLDLVSPWPSPEERVIARRERLARVEELRVKLSCRSSRARFVVCLALLGIRGEEIGRVMHMTAARVSQITTGFAGTAPPRKRKTGRRRLASPQR
jgi:hypothetical protein